MSVKNRKLLLPVIVLIFSVALILIYAQNQKPKTEAVSTTANIETAQPPPAKPGDIPAPTPQSIAGSAISEGQKLKLLSTLPAEIQKQYEKAPPVDPLNFSKLDEKSCLTEIYKMAYLSYLQNRHINSMSMEYCRRNVFKMDYKEFDVYQYLIAAAQKRQKTYNLKGKEIDLSEENLKKLAGQ